MLQKVFCLSTPHHLDAGHRKYAGFEVWRSVFRHRLVFHMIRHGQTWSDMISTSEFRGYCNLTLRTTFATEAGSWCFPGSRSFSQPSSFHKVNDFDSTRQKDNSSPLHAACPWVTPDLWKLLAVISLDLIARVLKAKTLPTCRHFGPHAFMDGCPRRRWPSWCSTGGCRGWRGSGCGSRAALMRCGWGWWGWGGWRRCTGAPAAAEKKGNATVGGGFNPGHRMYVSLYYTYAFNYIYICICICIYIYIHIYSSSSSSSSSSSASSSSYTYIHIYILCSDRISETNPLVGC